MEIVEFLVANFKSGGIFMYGILLVLVVGTAIVVERTLALVIRGRVNARAFWREIEELIDRDKLADALQRTTTADAPLARVLAAGFSQQERALLFMAASFAAIRLDKLVGADERRIGTQASLTPRELAVLRLASIGKRNSQIAEALKLGAETTRSHFKKAQGKLGARNRTHAVCEALRQRLIS